MRIFRRRLLFIFAAARLIPSHGWQIVFIIGGTLPLILCPILIVWLPESLAILAVRGTRDGEVRALLGRIDASTRIAPGALRHQNGKRRIFAAHQRCDRSAAGYGATVGFVTSS